MFDLGNLKQTVCVLCAQRLGNSRRFRAQSLKARSLMMDLVEKHELITKQHITRVKHSTKQLKYNFVLTTLEPDHCDLHIVESDVSKQKTSQETFYSDYDIDIVKNEGNFDSVAIDGHNRELHEDNNANDEFTAGSEQLVTDDSIQINAKLLDENVECPSYVGVEQEAGIQCFIKCEIDHEYDHNDDTSTMHLMVSYS
ncbi:jg26709 [Pararge aegeria aegeria]|uniref:Jg26709 protein n=1 Tax=Pararge aegeria aegeria TaxID=348720 RepID=A0A8S4QUA7_9NEOP|nr:jg26709 [Pararge aegeria aegeria]